MGWGWWLFAIVVGIGAVVFAGAVIVVLAEERAKRSRRR